MPDPPDDPDAPAGARDGAAAARAVRSWWSAPPRWWLALELVLLFGTVPVVLWLFRDRAAAWLLPIVFGGGVLALVMLLADRSFDTRRLVAAGAALRDLRHLVLVRMLPAMAIVLAVYATLCFVGLEERERLFGFPRNAPDRWLIVMLAYPILSVYPQELLFRALFFHRYERVFGGGAMLVVASGMLFGWAHLPFGTWIAPVLCTLGGLLFAWTWHRTRSMAAVTIEHGAWGDFAFTIGLGWYFFTGSIAETV